MLKRTIPAVINFLEKNPVFYRVLKNSEKIHEIVKYSVREIKNNSFEQRISVVLKDGRLGSSNLDDLRIHYNTNRSNVNSVENFKKDFALSNDKNVFLSKEDAEKHCNLCNLIES